MRTLLALFVILGLLPPLTGYGAELRHRIILAHTQPQDAAADPAAALASEFKRRVEQATEGGIRVDIFPDGMVGGNRQMTNLVSRNIIQSALVTVGGLTPLYPPLAVVQMPFALDSVTAAYSLYDGPFGQRLADEVEARTGMVVLGFGDAGGFHVITNSRRPVRSVKDLAGLRLRTIPGADVLDAMIRGVHATPVKVSSREELSALAGGIIDGQMNPPTVLLNRRYDQVQRHVTLTNHLYLPYVWLFAKAAFDALSPEDRQAVRDATAAAVTAGRELSRRVESSEDGMQTLHRRMNVITLSAAQREEMRGAAQPAVRQAIVQTQGEDGQRLLDDFLTAAKTANSQP
ncbi:TRAP-type C4-dicarboxylate transport system [Candidatus Terasakiella magnetica]|nr:TRAP-type C4-dicarboxylate transport system [Candidatus Terasakiella magnetica]